MYLFVHYVIFEQNVVLWLFEVVATIVKMSSQPQQKPSKIGS